MNNLEKLENKVADKVEKVVNVDTYDRGTERLLAQGDSIYRLIDNTTRRIERSLKNVNAKQDLILELLENEGLDVDEIKRLKEIKELEQKLSKLKSEV